MSKRQPSPVRLPLAEAASAFGLTTGAARQYIKRGAPCDGDEIEVGAFAAWLARTTIGGRHAQAT